MKGGKIPDDFFKDKIDYCGLEDNIYNQLARTMARNVDIDFAKTPIVDILTGYTRYREAENRVEQLEKENKELRDENKRIFQNVNDDELLISNAMNYAEAQEYKLKYEQLENIIKEAIMYVETIQKSENNVNPYILHAPTLLNILNKGSAE